MMNDDLISMQKAIEVVAKYFEFIQLNGDICIDGLISLPSETMLIHVDDRLPEQDKNVLMFYSQDKMEIGYYHYDSTFYPTEFEDLNDTGWYTKDDDVADDPVAWMPLPECYKGGEK